MARREFTRTVYAQIVHRAMRGGEICCEGCGLVLGKKPYHVDHTKPDALEVDKSRKLTADDGRLLGVECCHKPKTVQDVAVIAEAKRREAKHLGMKTRVKAKIPSPPKAPKPAPKPALAPRPMFKQIGDSHA